MLCCSFMLPEGLRLANLEGLDEKLDASVHEAGWGSGLSRHFEDNIDASLTWSFVSWLRSVTSLPIFVKVRALGIPPHTLGLCTFVSCLIII